MLKIRLRRMGAPKKPSYRLVVADSRAPQRGSFLEIVGHYDPMTDPETITVDNDKIKNWLAKGAQPTDTTRRLLKKSGLL